MKYRKDQPKLEVLNEPLEGYLSLDFFHLASKAISKDYIKRVIKNSRLGVSEFIDLIPISIDTYKRKAVFNPPVTEKVLEVEQVYKKGLEAFGNGFYKWMESPNPTLGYKMPKELLVNSFGIRQLIAEIGRMEHGVLA